ncbi:hypothetical protein QPK32_07285 [Massilia sp. YIM B02763]|uniref:hypothetical protein n=1 Tax=Massilia sp. YIM B02763 TaxID=3050130 RepID=UPI0025B68D3D|nr:hypothetical protein [Massilia sp. YIM B02763]MDN4052875.1 hypothetical protein [Massilia sp. YIM B02763]
MSTRTTSNSDLQLTAQERQLIDVFRSMSSAAKPTFIAMGKGIARGDPAARDSAPRLKLVHSQDRN